MQERIAQVDLGEGWRILACNAALAALVGVRAPGELVGRDFSEFVPDRIVLDRLLAGMRASGGNAGSEIELKRLDGGSLPVVIVLSRHVGDDGTPAVTALLVEAADTARRNVLGAQRMEAVGRLAGGIAHDFNNLLMLIGGHAERVLDLAGEGPLRASATAIQDAVDRAASLTRQLLAFGRRQTLQARVTELAALVAGLQPRLQTLLPPGVSMTLDLADGPAVRVDGLRLEDALASLVVNACNAMPHGGTLTIRTGPKTVADGASRPRPWIRPGQYAELVVSDTGYGMDEATTRRVFEPFFTTGALRRGGGLGLSTVYGFVKQSHGYILAESEVGRGSSFTILLPAVSAARDSADVAAAHPTPLETILIVSGHEGFRTEVGDALRLEGYHVLDAPTGERATEVFAAYTDRVHLLLVDVKASAEDERLLVNRLHALDPLLQSLYLVDSSRRDAASRPALDRPVLLKPVSVEVVVARVRDALDSGEGR